MIFNASSKYFNKKALATVATCVVLAAGCTDEMIRYDNGDGRLRFDISLDSSWTKGGVTTRGASTDICIEEIDATEDGRQLYLISESEDLDTYPAATPCTRGTSRDIFIRAMKPLICTAILKKILHSLRKWAFGATACPLPGPEFTPTVLMKNLMRKA